MLLDLAKESADAFPPLESCLGGINALIKVRFGRIRHAAISAHPSIAGK
jgi:hypothetical protein